jgi:hypothetical protein
MAASRTTRKFRKQMRKTRRKGGKRGPPSSSAQTFQLHDSTKNRCNPSRQEYYRRAWNDFQKRDNYRKINNELIKKASTEDNENYAKLRDLYKKTKKNKKGPQLDDILIDYDEPKTRGKVTCFEGDSPPHKKIITPKRRSSEFNFDLQYGKNPSISRCHTYKNLREMTPKEEYDRCKRGESLLSLRKSSSPSLEEP